MLFSYAVRSVYIESCSLFVRGGVYRVVKEAMGGFLAKLSVSALMFDYILTGPISGVSAGQYIIGLRAGGADRTASRRSISTKRRKQAIKSWGSVVIACADHALLLPAEPARHPRVERQGAEDHDRHHGHGASSCSSGAADHAGRARAGQSIAAWQPDLQQESRARRGRTRRAQDQSR